MFTKSKHRSTYNTQSFVSTTEIWVAGVRERDRHRDQIQITHTGRVHRKFCTLA